VFGVVFDVGLTRSLSMSLRIAFHRPGDSSVAAGEHQPTAKFIGRSQVPSSAEPEAVDLYELQYLSRRPCSVKRENRRLEILDVRAGAQAARAAQFLPCAG